MRSKLASYKRSAERVVKDIRRKTSCQSLAGEMIGIVMEGRRGDDSVSKLCPKEEIAHSRYYT